MYQKPLIFKPLGILQKLHLEDEDSEGYERLAVIAQDPQG